MPPPRFLRRDPDGADVFSSEDGAEVRVASGASPYAQSLQQQPNPLAPVLQRFSRTLTLDGGQGSTLPEPAAFGADLPNPSEWMVQPQEPVPEPAPAPFTYHQDQPAAASVPGVPAEWFAQAHAGPPLRPAPRPAAPPSMAGVAREMMQADPTAPIAEAPGAADPAAPAALDLTGGVTGAPLAAPRGGVRRGGGGTRGPAPDPLDALMVPGGYSDPTGAIAGNARDRTLDRGENLIDQAGALAQQRAQAQGQAADMVRQQIEESEQRRAELEQDRQRAMGEARGRYARAVERVSAMNVDPGRAFSQPADVIGAAIGIALGAAASAISGDSSHQDNALQLIQSHIDRDIEAQRANMAHAQAGLAAEESILSQTSAEFDSREGAEQAARAAMLEAVAQRIAAMEADLGTDEARLQAEQLRFDFQAQAQEAAAAAQAAEENALMQRALQMARLERIQLQNAQTAQRLSGGPAAPRAPSAEAMAQFNQLVASGVSEADAAQSLRISPEFLPRGGRYQAPTTGEQSGTVAALSGQLDALEGLLPRDSADDIPGHGYTAALPDFMVSEQGRAIRQQLGATIELLGRLHSGGAISDDEFTRFRGIIGGDTDEGLRRGIGIIRQELADRADRGISTQSRAQVTADALGRVGAERVE